MRATGITAFDSTLQKTHLWLNNLMQELRWDNRQGAYIALRAVLHALRDRLTVDEAAQLGAQLPMLVRGFYYEGWRPARTPVNERTKAAFLEHIRANVRVDPEDLAVDPEQLARAVFMVLFGFVSTGELEDVRGMFPQEVQDLWPVMGRTMGPAQS